MTGEELKEEIKRTGLTVSQVARDIGYSPSRLVQRMKIKGNVSPELVAMVNGVIAPYKEQTGSTEIIRALRQEVALLLQQNAELHKIIDKLTNPGTF